MPVDIERLLRERTALKAQTDAWMQDWQNIADLLIPGQSDILTLRQPGTSRTRQIYDSTPMWALDTFVSHLGAWVTNWQMQWFALRMRALRDNQEAAKWLDEVAESQYEEMIADEAPVPTAVNMSYRIYGGFGTGAFFVDERPMDHEPMTGFRGYQAEALNIGHYYIAENAGNRVDTLYRDIEITPHQAEQYWGRDALHSDMQAALSDQSGASRRYDPVDFTHAVYPRRGRDATMNDEQNMPWASVYVDRKNKHIVHEGGFRWFPFIVYRWEKIVPYCPFGFGRGHLVLPESRTLQLIDKDALRALPLTILPPGWLIGESRETIGRISLLPGVLNPLAKGGGFVPYNSGQHWDIAQLQIEERRQRVLRAFFIDQLQYLPDPGQRTQRTLGELQLRQRQMARIMGPAFMRLLSEMLNPFIDVTFNLKLHARGFPDPPDVVIDAALRGEGIINVDYLGELARAQKTDEVDAILEGVEFLLNVAERTGDPLVVQNMAIDDTMARFLQARGFPEALITDKRLMELARQEAARQLQKRQELEEAGAVAQTAGAAAPAMREIREFANA